MVRLRRRSRTSFAVITVAVLSAFLLTSPVRAQSGSQTGQPAASFQLPPLIVTAQKEPADPQALPLSMTTVARPTLQNAGIQIVSEAGAYGPNLWFTEFTARKLSSARFRGIGASPANPSITTLFDGVPQLHANSANIDLVDRAWRRLTHSRRGKFTTDGSARSPEAIATYITKATSYSPRTGRLSNTALETLLLALHGRRLPIIRRSRRARGEQRRSVDRNETPAEAMQ